MQNKHDGHKKNKLLHRIFKHGCQRGKVKQTLMVVLHKSLILHCMQSSTTSSDEEWARPGWQQHLLFKCHLCWSWLDPHCRGEWVLLSAGVTADCSATGALHDSTTP